MKPLRQSLFNALRHPGRGARLAAILIVVGVAVALVWPAFPHTMRISYRLPAQVASLLVEYERDDEVVRSATFRWADAESPTVLRHEPELAAGQVVIVVTLRDGDGRTGRARRSVTLDADRLTHVDLRGAFGSGSPESL